MDKYLKILVSVFLVSTVTMASLFIFVVILNPPEQNEPIIIKTGWFTGRCPGYCNGDITFTSEKIVFHAQHKILPIENSCSEINKEISFTKEEFQSLIQLVDLEKFYALPNTIGCPDCTDGGAMWIEVSDGGYITKRVTFSNLDEVSEIKNFAKELSDMINELRSQYLSNCVD